MRRALCSSHRALSSYQQVLSRQEGLCWRDNNIIKIYIASIACIVFIGDSVAAGIQVEFLRLVTPRIPV